MASEDDFSGIPDEVKAALLGAIATGVQNARNAQAAEAAEEEAMQAARKAERLAREAEEAAAFALEPPFTRLTDDVTVVVLGKPGVGKKALLKAWFPHENHSARSKPEPDGFFHDKSGLIYNSTIYHPKYRSCRREDGKVEGYCVFQLPLSDESYRKLHKKLCNPISDTIDLNNPHHVVPAILERIQYKSLAGFLIVYDVADQSSLYWALVFAAHLDKMKKARGKPRLLVGNKADLSDQVQRDAPTDSCSPFTDGAPVPRDVFKFYESVKASNAPVLDSNLSPSDFVEVSGKTGAGVSAAFDTMWSAFMLYWSAKAERKLKKRQEEQLRTLARQPVDYDVIVVSASNVPAMDRNGLSDPFVEVYFGTEPNKQVLLATTPVIKKTLNPVWKHRIRGKITCPPSTGVVVFKLWDKDLIGRDYIGVATLSGLPAADGPFDFELPICRESEEKNLVPTDAVLWVKLFKSTESTSSIPGKALP